MSPYVRLRSDCARFEGSASTPVKPNVRFAPEAALPVGSRLGGDADSICSTGVLPGVTHTRRCLVAP
jgi:hypothetical protein